MKQIMMKGKQRVKGTVLFTVVTVMMIMVVFLMSTLILTTSANRRSYYTYYKTQAQYAAQSALDCITNFAYSDGDFSEWVQSITPGDTREHEIFINYEGSKMPLSDIKAPNKSVRCTIKREKDNYIYDTITEKIHKQPQWKITATAVIGTGRNRTEAKKATYLYANVQTPKMSDVKNEITYTQHLYDETITYEETDEYIDDPGSPFTPIANAVYSLSPTGTDDNVVVLGPQYSGMTRIPKGRTKYGDVNGVYQAIKNDLGGVSDGIFNGNSKITVKNGYVFQRQGEGMQYYGNLLFNNAGDYFTTRVKATDTTKWAYNKQNYVFVEGMIYNVGGKLSIGYDKAASSDAGNTAAEKSSRPVNLFAGGVMFDKVNGGANVCGDVYLYDPQLSSQWTAFQGSTILSTFVARNVDGTATTAKYSGTHGNLVCNNTSLTLGGGAGTLTIQGDLLFTNPNGSVNFASAVRVNGKAIFACPASKVSGAGNLTADGGIIYSNDTGYAAALEQVMKTSFPSGAYGKGTSGEIMLSAYKSSAGSNDFSLLPFNYRLDEIMAKYYRWDLADNAGWQNDPYVRESQACGHKWQTKAFTATVFDHTENVNETGLTQTELSTYGVTDPYNDNRVTQEGWSNERGGMLFSFRGQKDVYTTKTVTVPYTTPVVESNIIIQKPFEPIDYQKAAEVVSDRSTLSYKNIGTFKSDMASGAPSITAANKASYGYSGPLSWAYPDGGTVKTASNNVYYVNFDCEIDMAAIPAGEILFIDASQSASRPLRVAIKGSLANRYILINNTAKYKGGAAAPTIDFTYGSADAKDAEGKPVYFGREDVFLFLESGVNLEKALILTTGVAGGYQGKPNIESKLTLDVVSNPYYPGTTEWNGLTAAEKLKFMYVPNNVIFGEEDASYTFTNGGMFTGVVMMPYSTVTHKSQTQKLDIKYRMDHDSVAVDPNGLSQSGNAPVLVSIGSQVVGKFIGENVSTVAYIGDGNRAGSKTRRIVEKKDVQETGSDPNSKSEDPAFNNGQDKFSNDHQAPS